MTTTKPEAAGIRDRLLKAMSHPVRHKALAILSERVASASGIARELRLPTPGHVSYHVNELEKAGLVEEVDTRRVRGAVETFYRSVCRPWLKTGEWEKMSAGERREFSEHIVALIVNDIAGAFEAGTLDGRLDRHLSRVPLKLDEQAWTDLTEAEDEWLDRTLEIQAESDARRNGSDEPSIPVIAMLGAFEMPGSQRPMVNPS